MEESDVKYQRVKIYPNIGDVFYILVPVRSSDPESDVEEFLDKILQDWVATEYSMEGEPA